jgi:hypothetical protein
MKTRKSRGPGSVDCLAVSVETVCDEDVAVAVTKWSDASLDIKDGREGGVGFIDDGGGYYDAGSGFMVAATTVSLLMAVVALLMAAKAL